MLEGKNIICLDLEVLHSPDDCRYCGKSNDDCVRGYPVPENTHTFTKIGWENHAALGLSIGCYYDYRDNRMHWFDVHTLEATVQHFIETQPLLVSFNGINFDFPLMLACLSQVPSYPDWEEWRQLCATSYDILAEVWKADSTRKFERRLNSLDAIAGANRLGSKTGNGAQATRDWQAGKIATVLNYCSNDVYLTKNLFELILQQGGIILRGDGNTITLDLPNLA